MLKLTYATVYVGGSCGLGVLNFSLRLFLPTEIRAEQLISPDNQLQLCLTWFARHAAVLSTTRRYLPATEREVQLRNCTELVNACSLDLYLGYTEHCVYTLTVHVGGV